MDEELIKLDNLGIGYDGRPVLSGISLSIARDSFTAVFGVNGSGKSTLLKTLLGLIPPVAGRMITSTSKDVPLVFGYVPQASEFDPIYLLTAFDVALMGTYGRVRPGRFVPRAERVFARECLQATGAEELGHKRFAELSGGQKQRVLIARALITRPDVLVLDEPTAGVDNETKHVVLEFIAQIRKEKKTTVLLVTHDFDVVRQYAQQVLWLHGGKVLQGTADELFTSERMTQILALGVA